MHTRFCLETSVGRDYFRKLGIVWMIVLKLILRK